MCVAYRCLRVTNLTLFPPHQIPNDLDSDDILTFNITLLLPQPGPAINYSSFATMLPLFHQHYGSTLR